MNSKVWIRKALSMCLCVALLATYSMVALAGSGKVAGELIVSGTNVDGETPVVMVNGEAAKSGRSIFSSSTINTPENANAVIDLGKLGKIALDPSTSITLSFDEKGINGDLTAGKLTVRGTSSGVNIKTADGNTVTLNAGDAVTASGKKQDDDDDDDDGGMAWWGFALIFGGAAVGILWAATQGDNRSDLGGGGTVVSPNQ